MDHLKKENVLVLNRNWQAIHVKNPAEAISMMYSDSATGLDVRGEDNMVPLKWNDWLNLEIGENDDSIQTINGKIKIKKRSSFIDRISRI